MLHKNGVFLMIRKMVALSLLFNVPSLYSMGSKARAIVGKLPLVSGLAAGQLYKENDENHEKRLKEWKKVANSVGPVDNYIGHAINKLLGYGEDGLPTSYIEKRLEKRLKGKLPKDFKVNVVRSNSQGFGIKTPWYLPNIPLEFPSNSNSVVMPTSNQAYLYLSEDPSTTSISDVEHEISHIQRIFLMKFDGWYREHGQKLYIPAAIHACLILTGLKKTIALGAVALANSFHEQMSNLISRYVEQDADDHIPDEKIYLEDAVKRFEKQNTEYKDWYSQVLLHKEKEDTFLSLCQFLDQFPLCEDKKWGYSLWQIIKVDPTHPPVNIRLEKFRKRLDKLNEIKEEEIEDFLTLD